MSRKTRHIIHFITESKLRVVINNDARVYHCRTTCGTSDEDWQTLVNEVINGHGAHWSASPKYRQWFDTAKSYIL